MDFRGTEISRYHEDPMQDKHRIWHPGSCHIHYCWPMLTHDIFISPAGIGKGCELMSWTGVSLIHKGCIDGNSNCLTADNLVQTPRASFFTQSLVVGTWEVRKCCCWSLRNGTLSPRGISCYLIVMHNLSPSRWQINLLMRVAVIPLHIWSRRMWSQTIKIIIMDTVQLGGHFKNGSEVTSIHLFIFIGVSARATTWFISLCF